MSERTLTGPEVTERSIRFGLADPDRELHAVRLYQEISRPRSAPELTYIEERAGWECDFPRPEADRLEYLFEVEHGGERALVTDPSNPVTAAGPFGEKSVVEMPGYRPPDWLSATITTPGDVTEFEVPCRVVKGTLQGILWAPPATDPSEPLPLLLAHDGLDYAAFSSLTRFLDAMVLSGRLPRARAALIAPQDRDHLYSASASYARSLAHEIIPAIVALAPTIPGPRALVGMGSSLGALSLLHAHRRDPHRYCALFLQSGSYFRQRFDRQESGFVRFRRISRFIGAVLAASHWPHPIDVVMTCGYRARR